MSELVDLNSKKYEKTKIVTCPYNKEHRMQQGRLIRHIVRCQKHYPADHLVSCRFNVLHRIKPKDIDTHELTCSDQHILHTTHQTVHDHFLTHLRKQKEEELNNCNESNSTSPSVKSERKKEKIKKNLEKEESEKWTIIDNTKRKRFIKFTDKMCEIEEDEDGKEIKLLSDMFKSRI
ncbi:hypothetical protein SNEBB_004699 [Seison nebaliae]|nr:hypothetical protein SNEBB_004699 [Seison nebaliae]